MRSNELIRSDSSWSGYERNVMFANNRDGTFSEVSGAVGLDFPEDSRSFALADLDHDGRLEVILKNRNAPQLRILHNAMKEIGPSIAFRLRGTQKQSRCASEPRSPSRREAFARQSICRPDPGFLPSIRKKFSLEWESRKAVIRATVRWPSGLSQTFENLPVNHRIEIEEGSAQICGQTLRRAPGLGASGTTAEARTAAFPGGYMAD